MSLYDDMPLFDIAILFELKSSTVKALFRSI